MPRSKNKKMSSGAVRRVLQCECGYRKAGPKQQMDTAWRLHGKICALAHDLPPSKMVLPVVHLLGTTTISRTLTAADLELHKEINGVPLYEASYVPTQVAKS